MGSPQDKHASVVALIGEGITVDTIYIVNVAYMLTSRAYCAHDIELAGGKILPAQPTCQAAS